MDVELKLASTELWPLTKFEDGQTEADAPCFLPVGLALHFHKQLRSSGAFLLLWGASVFRLLCHCSWVSLDTSGGSGPLLPGVSRLGDHILLLKTSRGAKKGRVP